MRSRLLITALAALPIVFVSVPAFAFSASFRWCSGSPAFTLRGVPKGTTKLDFWMTDLFKPEYRHGGGTVLYKGQSSIACGAFDGSFNGPSPPPGQVHTYEFEIKAIGANGQTLATTTARKNFP